MPINREGGWVGATVDPDAMAERKTCHWQDGARGWTEHLFGRSLVRMSAGALAIHSGLGVGSKWCDHTGQQSEYFKQRKKRDQQIVDSL